MRSCAKPLMLKSMSHKKAQKAQVDLIRFNFSRFVHRNKAGIEAIEILSADDWLQEKESNLRLRSQSPTCCRLHHPAKRFGALGFEPRTLRWSGANTAYKTAALPIELCPVNLVAAEGLEPSSLDYRSSALPIVLHRDGRSGGAQTRTSRLKRPLLCRSSSGSKEWLWRKDSNLR